jgi:hypothetical protein
MSKSVYGGIRPTLLPHLQGHSMIVLPVPTVSTFLTSHKQVLTCTTAGLRSYCFAKARFAATVAGLLLLPCGA